MKKLYIAIDGPSASGKGTIAKLLGERLGLEILYTGNIYRAIACKILQNKIDPQDVNKVVQVAQQLKLEDLDNPDLTQEIIGQYASIIGVYPLLRDVTYRFIRDFIENSDGAVVEGRDIGTVVCPEADFKFFITANVETRAKRRVAQQHNSNYEIILSDLKLRDERDKNRSAAPLKAASDAIIVDTSDLDAMQTLEKLLGFMNLGI